MAYLGPSLRRTVLRERPAARAAAAVVLSLLGNAVLLALLAAAGVFRVPEVADVKPVALAPLTAEQWERNRALEGAVAQAVPRADQAPAPAPPRPKPTPPPPPPPAVDETANVVDVAPSDDNRAPEGKALLADRNNRVEKETISRHAGDRLWENTLSAPSDGSPGRKGARALGEDGEAPMSRPGREGPAPAPARAPPSRPALPKGDQLAVAPRMPGEGQGPRASTPGVPVPVPAPSPPADATPGETAAPREGDGEDGARSAGSRVNLRPDASMLARIAGGPAPITVEGLELGEATALNTREFRFATYINRVADGVQLAERVWDTYLARDPTFDMYPIRRWKVDLEITLGPEGELEDVRVVSPSGLSFVDRELVRAVRQAAPFPNPPEGLKGQDGRIRLGQRWALDVEDLRRRVSAATGRP